MTFLPIVERELRASARRAFTYWSRPSTALVALLIFGAYQIIFEFLPAGIGISAGQLEFASLKWLTFVFACATGVFFTADSLSEEKREGTLGLLFLTDLHGHDVVLGKLVSHSLRAFYGVLAVLPALGLTLLVGGVTGLEFARASLVICNTLFFSLALGLLVSSLSRDAIKAMTTAFLAAFFLLLGLPWIDLAIARWKPANFIPRLSIASPGYLFRVTDATRPVEFWRWLGIQHGLAWIFLAIASFRTPRSWQEKSAGTDLRDMGLFRRMRFGGMRARLALRRKLMEPQPVFWLAMRDRWLPRMVWILTAIVTVSSGWGLVNQYRAYTKIVRGAPSVVFTESTGFVQILLSFGLILWVASQASGFFVEGIRTGALELILVTPVTPREIVCSRWRALWRTFAFPLAVIILFQVASGVMSMLSFIKMTASSNASFNGNFVYSQFASIVSGALVTATNLAALGWFGMWMGLKTRKHSMAVLKTIGIVSVLPFVASMTFFLALQVVAMQFIVRQYSSSASWSIQVAESLMACMPSLVMICADVFFILWARRKLFTRFNEMVAQAGQAPIRRLRQASPIGEPPVIPTEISARSVPPKVEISQP